MRRATFGLIVGLGLAAGCSKSSGEPAAAGPPTPVVPVVALAPEPRAMAQPAPAAVPAAPFRFPDDAGGKAVAAALAPSVPEASMAQSARPRPRTSELDRGEVPLPRVAATLPRAPLPRAKSPRPTPPPERVPADLGQAAALNPIALRLPERAPVRVDPPPTPSATDVPALARQVPDRASLEDPTAEIAASRVVFTAMPLPFTPGWFLRFTIPDPFESAEQMKAKTGESGEFGTQPVNVPPARPK